MGCRVRVGSDERSQTVGIRTLAALGASDLAGPDELALLEQFASIELPSTPETPTLTLRDSSCMWSAKGRTTMTEPVVVRPPEVAAAQLQLVIDRKLGRESSATVKAIAAAKPDTRGHRGRRTTKSDLDRRS